MIPFGGRPAPPFSTRNTRGQVANGGPRVARLLCRMGCSTKRPAAGLRPPTFSLALGLSLRLEEPDHLGVVEALCVVFASASVVDAGHLVCFPPVGSAWVSALF